MRIVVLDGFAPNPGDLSWERLSALAPADIYVSTRKDQIISRIGDAEIVLVNRSNITKRVLDCCPNIRYIGVTSTGYNCLDLAECRKRGIVITNVPAYGTNAVAQHAIALLLEICSRAGHHSRAVKNGRWGAGPEWCFWDYPIIELAGKTMGIVGYGRIGRQTAKIASALGMKVIAYDEYRFDTGESGTAEYAEMDELFAASDVISLHCPYSEKTGTVINKSSISKMRDGVIIINVSRGMLVDEKDLADALNSGKVYAAGLDVVSQEPITEDNPLLTAENCFITPHIAWAAKESRMRMLDIATDNVIAYLNGNPINTI